MPSAAQSVPSCVYNSTSTLQRRVVFGLDRPGITAIAVNGTKLIKELVPTVPETEVILQYSPESFTGTELEYAVEICEAVMDAWGPTPERKMIFNLPATVEMATPNIFADQIEWFGRKIKDRDCFILSIHPHNDRGTGVAAAELAMMAGAERVEGTLLGNGERTGNVDVVNLALNMLTGRRSGWNPRHREVIQAYSITSYRCIPAIPMRAAGVHGLLRLPSGRHQEGPDGASAKQQRPVGRSLSAHRSQRSRPQL
jgi:isopropylmalate/homocitrate/citramalate synthase